MTKKDDRSPPICNRKKNIRNKYIKQSKDICDDCFNCKYFEHDYWNCVGQSTRCHEFKEKQ